MKYLNCFQNDLIVFVVKKKNQSWQTALILEVENSRLINYKIYNSTRNLATLEGIRSGDLNHVRESMVGPNHKMAKIL